MGRKWGRSKIKSQKADSRSLFPGRQVANHVEAMARNRRLLLLCLPSAITVMILQFLLKKDPFLQFCHQGNGLILQKIDL